MPGHGGTVTTSQEDEPVYARTGPFIVVNQVGIKVAMDRVSDQDYFAWLDGSSLTLGSEVPGAQIAEKPEARVSPSMHVAVYYDTPDLRLLPTGALLRATDRAYCTFKAPSDGDRVRRDSRYEFSGDDRALIERAPDSPEAIAMVQRLLARTDIEHPGRELSANYGIDPASLRPVLRLDDRRFTFFVWLDGKDALRCSLDRFEVQNLRLPVASRERKQLAEVELSIYPRSDPEVARDPRVRTVIEVLSDSLCEKFGVSITSLIKYQRAAQALGMAAS